MGLLDFSLNFRCCQSDTNPCGPCPYPHLWWAIFAHSVQLTVVINMSSMIRRSKMLFCCHTFIWDIPENLQVDRSSSSMNDPKKKKKKSCHGQQNAKRSTKFSIYIFQFNLVFSYTIPVQLQNYNNQIKRTLKKLEQELWLHHDQHCYMQDIQTSYSCPPASDLNLCR